LPKSKNKLKPGPSQAIEEPMDDQEPPLDVAGLMVGTNRIKMHFIRWAWVQLFLNANLKKEIYIMQPEGFISEDHPDYVCKLNKCLYGLKQAPREWFLMINDHLKKSG